MEETPQTKLDLAQFGARLQTHAGTTMYVLAILAAVVAVTASFVPSSRNLLVTVSWIFLVLAVVAAIVLVIAKHLSDRALDDVDSVPEDTRSPL